MLSSVSLKRPKSLQYPLASSQPHPSPCSTFHPGLYFFITSLFLPLMSPKLSRNLLFPEFQLRVLQARASSAYIEYLTNQIWQQWPHHFLAAVISEWRCRIFGFEVVLLMPAQRQGMDNLSIYLS